MIPNLLDCFAEKDMAMRAVDVLIQFENDDKYGEVLISVPYAFMKGGNRTRLGIQLFEPKTEPLPEI